MSGKWAFWNRMRAQEQQGRGPFSSLDQLPKGARVQQPRHHGQQQQQAPPDPEHAARVAMAGGE